MNDWFSPVLTVLGAYIVLGLTGFGSALLMVPLRPPRALPERPMTAPSGTSNGRFQDDLRPAGAQWLRAGGQVAGLKG